MKGAGAKGDPVADAGEPKRPPPARGAPKGEVVGAGAGAGFAPPKLNPDDAAAAGSGACAGAVPPKLNPDDAGAAGAGAPPKLNPKDAVAAGASSTIEGIDALSARDRVVEAPRPLLPPRPLVSAAPLRRTQPSLPQPVRGGLSSVDATEYSMVGGWFEMLSIIHHLPSRRMIVRNTCPSPEATLGSPTLT